MPNCDPSLYQMAEIETSLIPIPELKNCYPSERHIRTNLYQALLGSEPPETAMCDDGQNPRQYEVKFGCCLAKG